MKARWILFFICISFLLDESISQTTNLDETSKDETTAVTLYNLTDDSSIFI